MLLYINNEYCTSFEQLRSYFITLPEFGSDLYLDLIESGRDQTISQWLHDKVGNAEMAHQIESIDDQLGDTDYLKEMRRIILGEKFMEEFSSKIDKPEFTACFNHEKTQLEQTENGYTVNVYLKVLMLVNETLELRIVTGWGTCGKLLKPLDYIIGEVKVFRFHFRKRPTKEFGDIMIFGDGTLLYKKSSVIDNKIVVDLKDVKFNMIKVIGGSFTMGATKEMDVPNNEIISSTNIDWEKPTHQVTLMSYYIGEAVVTQELWKIVMGRNPSSHIGDKLPVDSVSWNDCQKFIAKLNSLTGRKFRLPTEAEWEFAARGGCKSQGYLYSGSNDIDEVAWYRDNSACITHEIATKKPNELGIYDMSGNVYEWCQDWWYEKYCANEQINPTGPKCGKYRVYRGGNLFSEAWCCRPSWRYCNSPDAIHIRAGFRLALSDSERK